MSRAGGLLRRFRRPRLGLVDKQDRDAVVDAIRDAEAGVDEELLGLVILQRALVLRAGNDLQQSLINTHGLKEYPIGSPLPWVEVVKQDGHLVGVKLKVLEHVLLQRLLHPVDLLVQRRERPQGDLLRA